jgi:RNA polymerase sigma-70 factor (ECF subfamily)
MLDYRTKLELKKGNPKAYRDVFRFLYPRLKAYCKLFIGKESEVEDIIQEVFITLWEKRRSIKTEKSVDAWIFVMVRNRCLNRLKKHKLEQDDLEVDNLKIKDLQYLYQLDFMNKEEKSLEEKLIDSLKFAIDGLPLKMRKVLVECKIKGRQQKVVAEEMGISLKMVEKHIASAKKQLRKKLLKEYNRFLFLIVSLI